MLSLLFKEIKSALSSLSGIVFIIMYLLSCGSLLWIIPGGYNIPESGYSSLVSFFTISPVLFMILIPALSMRSFSEEKRLDTLSLLYSRPVSLRAIVFSKTVAVYVVALLSLIPTVVYVVSVYMLAKPSGNIDLTAIAGSYFGLLILTYGFVSISVFTSSLTSNQAVAFILGILLCFGFYFGFDLLSGLFVSGRLQLFVKNLGFLSHFELVQKGVIDSKSLFYMLFISSLFYLLTLYALKRRLDPKTIWGCLFISVVSLAGSFCFSYKIDCTKDKLYTISQSANDLVKKTDRPVEIDFYLDGNLNPGFLRLQKYMLDLLSDFSDISFGKITVKVIDPQLKENSELLNRLTAKGLNGVAVNEKGADGRLIQQLVFPWAVIKSGGVELPVALLTNEPRRSGQENLQASMDMAEYQFANAINTMLHGKKRKIVFLKGHSELSDTSLGDTWDMLSHFYQVDAGVLSKRVGELDDYEVVIIAGPQSPFVESEKYILDQYLMQGGKILLFANGVKLNNDLLAEKGESTVMANEVNLEDMLFVYGVRVNPVLVEDMQCLEIPLKRKDGADNSQYINVPWHFAPLLIPSEGNPVMKGISLVKTRFASTLSMVGEKKSGLKKQVLLTTSDNTYTVQVPEIISLSGAMKNKDKTFFKQKRLPVGILLEGNFRSSFVNRLPPEGLDVNNRTFMSQSKPAKLIVVASEEIIQNETYETKEGLAFFPLGYDRYAEKLYGNREFVLGAVNYLSENTDLISLRNKTHELQVLDKPQFYQNKIYYLFLNILIPLLTVVFMYIILLRWKKKRYKY